MSMLANDWIISIVMAADVFADVRYVNVLNSIIFILLFDITVTYSKCVGNNKI